MTDTPAIEPSSFFTACIGTGLKGEPCIAVISIGRGVTMMNLMDSAGARVWIKQMEMLADHLDKVTAHPPEEAADKWIFKHDDRTRKWVDIGVIEAAEAGPRAKPRRKVKTGRRGK